MTVLPRLPAGILTDTGRRNWNTSDFLNWEPLDLVALMRRILEADVSPTVRTRWAKALRATAVEATAAANGWKVGRAFPLEALAAAGGNAATAPDPLLLEEPTFFRCPMTGRPKAVAVHLTGGADVLEAAGAWAAGLGLQAVMGGVPEWHHPAVPVLYRPPPAGGRVGFVVAKLNEGSTGTGP